MSTTKAELDAFHHFAIQHLASEKSPLELDELLLKWYDDQHQDQIDAIIRQGLKDSEEGLGVSARQVTDEIRRKHGL